MFGLRIRPERDGRPAIEQRQERRDLGGPVVRVRRPAPPYGFTLSAWHEDWSRRMGLGD